MVFFSPRKPSTGQEMVRRRSRVCSDSPVVFLKTAVEIECEEMRRLRTMRRIATPKVSHMCAFVFGGHHSMKSARCGKE
jgi:hypothetical protein